MYVPLLLPTPLTSYSPIPSLTSHPGISALSPYQAVCCTSTILPFPPIFTDGGARARACFALDTDPMQHHDVCLLPIVAPLPTGAHG